MNYKNEIYPTDLTALLGKANKLSVRIIQELKSEKCPNINDLYKLNSKNHVIRQKQKFTEQSILPK